MSVIRFIRGTVWKQDVVNVGDQIEVTEREAILLCDGWKKAERVDGEAPAPRGMTVRDEIQTRDPVAEHRDPVAKPSMRRK